MKQRQQKMTDYSLCETCRQDGRYRAPGPPMTLLNFMESTNPSFVPKTCLTNKDFTEVLPDELLLQMLELAVLPSYPTDTIEY